MKRWMTGLAVTIGGSAIMLSVAAFVKSPAPAKPTSAQILRGRELVINHDCAGCHGGNSDPSSKGWLQGTMSPAQEFQIGACSFAHPDLKPCFITRPKNLTPDNETGTGRFTERQLFNALRYGLRPEETPDAEITGMTPGKGNFPLHPHYLAPPMPWMAWRHMSDEDLKAIVAYLKYGLKPVHNQVQDSDGPPDFWASEMTPDKIGQYPSSPFPTENEKK